MGKIIRNEWHCDFEDCDKVFENRTEEDYTPLFGDVPPHWLMIRTESLGSKKYICPRHELIAHGNTATGKNDYRMIFN